MDKSRREKIALIVFAALLVFAAFVLLSYFATGRAWNVAASFVDDMTGRMDGYAAIVYKGVVEPEQDEPAEGTGAQAGAPQGPSEGDGAAAAPSAPAAPAPEAGKLDIPSEAEIQDILSATPSEADTLGLSILSLLPRPHDVVEEVKENPDLYVSDVRNVYERKGASGLTLDVSDLDAFIPPQILYSGDKTIGVYAVDVYTTKAWLSRYFDYFEENGVDIVVGLTPRVGYLATLEGTDVVIVTSDKEGISTTGETHGSTLVVQSPDQGQVGVVIFNTSNVASARAIAAI